MLHISWLQQESYDSYCFCLGYSIPAVTEDPDDDWEDENDSSEADDDGRVYKNPRNFPSPGK